MEFESDSSANVLSRAFTVTALLMGVFLIVAKLVVPIVDVDAATSTTIALSDIKVTEPKNPIMKVLVSDAKKINKVTSNGRFVIQNEAGENLLVFKKNKWVQLKYKNNKYIAYRGKKTVTSNTPLRIKPLKLNKKVTVINMENRPLWDTSLNDNVFFGAIKLTYSDNSRKAMLVNDIPIERYVRGIAEVSDSQPKTYLKVLLTAARTYALYNIQHPTKHADEPYILSATDNDQIYRGANFSRRSPNVVAAQKATKAQIIRYKGKTIIAPYFSQSDGRTRSWHEVWNGGYEWAQTKADPCCEDKELKGHGVGMSGEGARYFAKEGWGWKKILKYYYTGVKIVEGY